MTSMFHSPTRKNDLSNEAFEIRKLIIEMTSQQEGAHIGGSLSIADVFCVLFNRILRLDPSNPVDPDRDFLILSKGHCAAVLYALLARHGFIDANEITTYAANGSRLAGHPSGQIPGVEFPTGSLGHGLSLGVGTALGLQRLGKGNRTFVVMGEGELQEGSVWEAAASAARFGLGNLVAIVDMNGMQINGPTDSWLPATATCEKWQAFGWDVEICDGHALGDIETTLQRALAGNGRPRMVLAKTTKAKGLPSLEGNKTSHYAAFMPEMRRRMLTELEAARP